MGLSQLLEALVRNTLSLREEYALVHVCHTVATELIRKFHSRHVRHFLHADYSDEAFAWRCITDLFLPRGPVKCYELSLFFLRQRESGSDLPEEEMRIALRRIVSRQVDQTIPEIYAELDGSFGRILRSVKRHVASSGKYIIRRMVHGTTLSAVEGDPMLHLPEIPREELLQRLFDRASPSMAVTDLVDTTFDVLHGQMEFRRAIPLLGVVAVLRDYLESFQSFAEPAVHFDWHAADESVLGEIHEETVLFVRDGIVRKYVDRGKYSPDDAVGLTNAVRAFLGDYMAGEPREYFEYFQEQFPRATYREYIAAQKNRFQYILPLARDEFIRRWKQRNGGL
jgi:hypothetical protein